MMCKECCHDILPGEKFVEDFDPYGRVDGYYHLRCVDDRLLRADKAMKETEEMINEDED